MIDFYHSPRKDENCSKLGDAKCFLLPMTWGQHSGRYFIGDKIKRKL